MDWSEVQPSGDYNRMWRCATSNRSGRVAVAVYGDAGTGGVYITKDGGASWAALLDDITDQEWACCAVSPNGDEIIVGADGGRLYLLKEGGATRTEIMPDGDIDKEWIAVAMSNYGKDIVAIAYNDYIYISNDHGESWNKTSMI